MRDIVSDCISKDVFKSFVLGDVFPLLPDYDNEFAFIVDFWGLLGKFTNRNVIGSRC